MKTRALQKTLDLISLFEDSTGLPAGKNDTASFTLMEIQTHYASLQNQLFQSSRHIQSGRKLFQLMATQDTYLPADTTLELYSIQPARGGEDKFYPARSMELYQSNVLVQKEKIGVEKSTFFPELSIGYFNWNVTQNYHFQGFQLGMTLPVWYYPNVQKVKQAKLLAQMAQNEADKQESSLKTKIDNLRTQLDKIFVEISYYRENALRLAEMQDERAVKAMSREQEGFDRYIQDMEQSLQTKLNYLEAVKSYNMAAIELEFYIE